MRKVLFVGLSVFLCIGIFLMFGTGKEPDGELRIAGGSFIEGIRILQKKKGVTLWDLSAKRADFENEDRARLSDISISFRENGVTLFADKGIYNLSEQSFTTDRAVRAEGKDYRITSESVDFQVSSGDIKTDGRVRMEGKGFEVEGEGLKAETQKEVKILNNVKAIFHK